MFAYIFFLKPPPSSVYRNEDLLLSLQVANDLRTEVSPVPIDIHFCWTRNREIIGPRKLATWSKASQYKAINVPHPPHPPSSATKSVEWKLVLTAAATSNALQVTAVDLTASSFSWNQPFPILSHPIRFYNAFKSARDKNEALRHIEYERRYRLAPSLPLTLSESMSFDLDKKIWDSGVGVSRFLCRLLSAPEPNASPLASSIGSVLRRVNFAAIELGAGTGLVSLVLAALLHSISTEGNRTIWATDLPSAMDLLSRNVARNAAVFSGLELKSTVLDWFDDRLPEEILKHTNGVDNLPFDLIIMSDVTYNSAVFDALLETVERLITQDKGIFILMGYKKRDEAEDTIWDMFQSHGINFELVEEIQGLGGSAVTIRWAEIQGGVVREYLT